MTGYYTSVSLLHRAGMWSSSVSLAVQQVIPAEPLSRSSARFFRCFRPHQIGDVGVDVQRSGRRYMAQYSGEGLPIYHVSQSNGGKRVAQVVEVHMLLDAGLSSRMRLILATAAGIQ